MATKAAIIAYFLSVSAISIHISLGQENETKPPSKKLFNKSFKAVQFHQKPFSYSDAETNEDDLENPFVPPPIPQSSAEADPWSTFLKLPSSSGGSGEGMGMSGPPNGRKIGAEKDAETEATRAQRFIGGPSAFDPFFFSNPLSPPSPPAMPPSPPRRHFGGGYGYHSCELFMVVQPRQCNNATEKNSTDVATKFLSGNGGPTSPNPEPSRCVFAIASCCAPFNYHVRYPCFEMLGCYNAFWDTNPCSEEVVAAAVNDLMTFYNGDAGGDNSTTTTTPAPSSTAAPAAPAES